MPKIKPQNTARAIVIGVSAYEDTANIKPLSGSVPDAIAYTNWLLDIGLRPENIVLHVSPKPDVSYDYPDGVERRDARRPTIWRSFADLMNINNASRLYVCASGHGVQTREGTCFLAQDFELETFSGQNLCIDLYIDQFLRGLRFKEQYLFIDCCSNYLQVQTMIQKVSSGAPGHTIAQRTPTKIHAFYACQEEERAQQYGGNGRGVFTSVLLNSISTKSIAKLWEDYGGQRFFSYDFTKAAWHLNLKNLFTEKITTDVEHASRKMSREFSPRYVLSANGNSDPHLYEFEDLPSTTLTITTKPEKDLHRLSRITATLPGVSPEFSKTSGNSPFKINAPLNRQLKLFGEPAKSSDQLKKRPLIINVKNKSGETARLEFASHPPSPPPSNKILDAYSATRLPSNSTEGFSPGGETRGLTRVSGGDAQFDGLGFPPSVGQIDIGASNEPEAPSDNLLITRTSGASEPIHERLPGWANLTIDGMDHDENHQMSLGSLSDETSMELSPGRYMAKIALPWGNWRKLLILNTGENTSLHIPDTISQTPLRFENDDSENKTWAWLQQTAENSEIGIYHTAQYGDIPLRRSLGNEGRSRVEPYSATMSVAWDILITNKRHQMANDKLLSDLIDHPPTDMMRSCLDILRLAGAYMSLNLENRKLAHSLYETLPEELMNSLDGRLISYDLNAHESDANYEVIVGYFERGDQPLLTYGYDIAEKCLKIEHSKQFIPYSDFLGPSAWTVIYKDNKSAKLDQTILTEKKL